VRRLALGCITLALAGVLAWLCWPAPALPPEAIADLVIVHKAARRLELFQSGTLLKSYAVSLGRHPSGPKQQQGDGRTPEGEYRLDYRNPISAFHRALHISYPGTADVAAARARGIAPGGLVMIHGMKNGFGWIGRLHRAVDWTDGCVAVTDAEMEEIWRAVPDGTRIVLTP
jgi:murein L,D-transpeptidase YafK